LLGVSTGRLGCSPTTWDRGLWHAAVIGVIHRPIGLQARRSRGRVRASTFTRGDSRMGSVVKKRRKRMAKKKHRKLLRKTRVQRRRLGK